MFQQKPEVEFVRCTDGVNLKLGQAPTFSAELVEGSHQLLVDICPAIQLKLDAWVCVARYGHVETTVLNQK